MKNEGGYKACGSDESKWAQFKGDPNYNLLNPCCQALNAGGNPGALGYTKIQQDTMAYMVKKGPGRDEFVRYWKLMADAVVDHPSAFAAELMNEPMTIHRSDMYDTWRAAAEAINAVVPDMSVALADIGEGAVIPAWVTKLAGAGVVIDSATVEWIKKSNNVFYAWHWWDIDDRYRS